MSLQNNQNQTKEERQKLSKEEDAELIRRACEGDQRAYSRLQKKYYGSISNHIRRMMRNNDYAEDLIQESFAKAFNALHTFNHEYAFSTWLYKIASNHCIDFLRKKKLDTFSINQPVRAGDSEIEYEISDSTWIPDTEIQQSERTKILRDAIEELPPKYKLVIHLRHEEEMDYQEIADKLGLPLGTVKAHLFRARAMLYNKLKNKVFHFYS